MCAIAARLARLHPWPLPRRAPTTGPDKPNWRCLLIARFHCSPVPVQRTKTGEPVVRDGKPVELTSHTLNPGGAPGPPGLLQRAHAPAALPCWSGMWHHAVPSKRNAADQLTRCLLILYLSPGLPRPSLPRACSALRHRRPRPAGRRALQASRRRRCSSCYCCCCCCSGRQCAVKSLAVWAWRTPAWLKQPLPLSTPASCPMPPCNAGRTCPKQAWRTSQPLSSTCWASRRARQGPALLPLRLPARCCHRRWPVVPPLPSRAAGAVALRCLAC